MSENGSEVVDATVETTALVERREATAMATVQAKSYPLAALSEEEFSALLESMTNHHARMRTVQRQLMQYGVHYGLPGVSESDYRAEIEKRGAEARKPGLLKSGAERLLALHRYIATTEVSVVYGDPKNETSPAISVRATCFVHADSLNGPIVGMGLGSCNSWETKYRWRDQSRFCPSCHKATIIKGKAEYGGGWVCFARKGGCGAKFADGDQSIEAQMAGRVANDAAHDLENTLLKMAEKRAKVDATLASTNTSDLFTQDVEDLMENGQGVQQERREEPAVKSQKAPTRSERAASANGPMTDAQRSVIVRLYEEKQGITEAEIVNVIPDWPHISSVAAGLQIAQLQK